MPKKSKRKGGKGDALTDEHLAVLERNGYKKNDDGYRGNVRVLADLLGGSTFREGKHLYSGNFDLQNESFYSATEMQKTMDRLEDSNNSIFVEEFGGKNRGSPFCTTGILVQRTYERLTQEPIFLAIIESIREILAAQWEIPTGKSVIFDKVWLTKSYGDVENFLNEVRAGKVAGQFNKHYDNYNSRSLVRFVNTLFTPDKSGQKWMGFDEESTGESVEIRCDHGQLIIMDKVASGADGKKKYGHYVWGAGDTYVLGGEARIGEVNESELIHVSFWNQIKPGVAECCNFYFDYDCLL